MTERQHLLVLQCALHGDDSELETEEERKAYVEKKKFLDDLRERFGEEKFKTFEFDVPYSYD